MNTTLSTDNPVNPAYKPRGWRLWIVAGTLAVAIVISVLWGARHKAQEGFFGLRLFPAKEAYNFTLTDQNGHPFQLSSLRGNVALFAFGFTHCPNLCPTTLSDLASMYHALSPREQSRVRILFISVDPQRDTPQALQQYVPYFDPNIIGLTGPKTEIDRTVQAYGASYEIGHKPGDDPGVYFVNHSTFTYLVNPQGKVELIYDYDKLQDTGKLKSDIERVLNEPGN
jgi:protein SCO1/2